jgi:hypothetical protein
MGNSLSIKWYILKHEHTVPEDVTPDDLPLHLYSPHCINPASEDLKRAWNDPESYRSGANMQNRINNPPIVKLIYSEAESAALENWRSQVITSIDRQIRPSSIVHISSSQARRCSYNHDRPYSHVNPDRTKRTPRSTSRRVGRQHTSICRWRLFAGMLGCMQTLEILRSISND